MRIAVVIPWRGGQKDREKHHQTVRWQLINMLPDAMPIEVDTGHMPFSRAGSRNLGVRVAQEAGYDVVVLNDADTLPEREPLLAAIESAHQNDRLVLPYTHFRGLSKRGTKDLLRGVPAVSCETELETTWSTGGVMVIKPSAWWRMGGMDENFTGWGMEDAAARVACDALLGPTIRHEGVITHLWHPSEIDQSSPSWQANSARMARYVEAEGNPEAVAAIVSEFRKELSWTS